MLKRSLALSLFLLAFFVLVGGVNANATTSSDYEVEESEIDVFLSGIGFPEDVINSLTYPGKLNIYENIDSSDNPVFDGHSEEDVYLPGSEEEYQISPQYIPKADLALNVSVVSLDDGSYLFFPNFVWKKNVKVNNDSFGFALDSNSWTTVAGDVLLNLRMPDFTPGHTENKVYDRATISNFSGHAFRIPKSDGKSFSHKYEGNAYFKARPKSGAIDKKIILRYGYDKPRLWGSASYSISIGVFSVSYTNTDGRLAQTAETLSWR